MLCAWRWILLLLVESAGYFLGERRTMDRSSFGAQESSNAHCLLASVADMALKREERHLAKHLCTSPTAFDAYTYIWENEELCR